MVVGLGMSFVVGRKEAPGIALEFPRNGAGMKTFPGGGKQARLPGGSCGLPVLLMAFLIAARGFDQPRTCFCAEAIFSSARGNPL